MFSTLPEQIYFVTFILSPANAFNLDQSKKLSTCKALKSPLAVLTMSFAKQPIQYLTIDQTTQ